MPPPCSPPWWCQIGTWEAWRGGKYIIYHSVCRDFLIPVNLYEILNQVWPMVQNTNVDDLDLYKTAKCSAIRQLLVNENMIKKICLRIKSVWPLRTLQRCESYPQQSDFVSRADHVTGVDAHGDLLDVRQVLVKLGQQSCGGVLLEPEELAGNKEEEKCDKVAEVFNVKVKIWMRSFCRRRYGSSEWP